MVLLQFFYPFIITLRLIYRSYYNNDHALSLIHGLPVFVFRDYGVMVQLYPTMQPTLIHNSQLDQKKVSSKEYLTESYIGYCIKRNCPSTMEQP